MTLPEIENYTDPATLRTDFVKYNEALDAYNDPNTGHVSDKVLAEIELQRDSITTLHNEFVKENISGSAGYWTSITAWTDLLGSDEPPTATSGKGIWKGYSFQTGNSPAIISSMTEIQQLAVIKSREDDMKVERASAKNLEGQKTANAQLVLGLGKSWDWFNTLSPEVRAQVLKQKADDDAKELEYARLVAGYQAVFSGEGGGMLQGLLPDSAVEGLAGLPIEVVQNMIRRSVRARSLMSMFPGRSIEDLMGLSDEVVISMLKQRDKPRFPGPRGMTIPRAQQVGL